MSRIRPRCLSVGGALAGVLEAGPAGAPPVLLIHGYSGDMLTWQFQIGALARHFRVVALDLPGHGISDPVETIGFWRDMLPWLAEAAAVLELDRPHLVGHSLGARLALGLVEEGLVAAQSVSLIACAGVSPRYDYDFLERMTGIASLEDALACSRRLLGADAPDPERFARALFQKLSPPEARASLRAYLASNFAGGKLKPDRPAAWDRVQCPLQLIWSVGDTVAPLPTPEWLPRPAQVHVLEGTSHLPHMTSADAVNGLLLAQALASDRG